MLIDVTCHVTVTVDAPDVDAGVHGVHRFVEEAVPGATVGVSDYDTGLPASAAPVLRVARDGETAVRA